MSTRDLLVASWLSRACDARLLDRLPGQWSAFLSLSVLQRLLVESKVQSYSSNKLWVNRTPKALQRLLGLSENTPIKRYPDAARSSRMQPEISLKQMREGSFSQGIRLIMEEKDFLSLAVLIQTKVKN